jgi:predicted transposase YbfD/YdcC
MELKAMAMGFGTVSPLAQQPQTQRAKKPLREIQANLLNYVAEIPDPRVERTKKHLLKDILVIAILAVIGGAEGWEDIENYGIDKQQWLEEFLELPNGIPSDDTFRRVFERINPEALEQCLTKWLQSMVGSIAGEVIAIDGKSLRGSYDRNQGVKALHLVSAWASQQRLVLGQVKVEDHSNEITAIPALLALLDLTGAIVSIDAMGTQTEVVKQIIAKKADYIVSLKANHPTLYSQVQQWFDTHRVNDFQGFDVSYDQHLDKGHHRTEKRYVWAVPLSAFGGLYQQQQWSGLKTIVIVERIRHLWNKTTREVQFYLTSLPADAQRLGRAIRQHWSIENQLYWTLDVTFEEDQCRIRSCHSPRNFAILRRMALNALNQEKTCKRSLRQKIKRAFVNNDYMMTVLNSFCQ